jgi:ribonucleoside-triphosphate reductase
VGVVTINMTRIAYLSHGEKDFYERLDRMMDLSARSLKIKRDIISKLMNEGLYPYTQRYLGTFENHFSTIGLVGMNEACLNARWIGEDIGNVRAQAFTKDVLNHMRNRLSDYQEKYGDLYNLEATPAESTSYRLAKHDVARYPDIVTASESGKTPYYTNSSHLPVGFTDDIFEALDVQDELQTLYTSGTVFHAFLGEKLPDWEAAARLVKKIAENYKLPYYTLSPTYSICKSHGYLAGEQFECPICGERAEVYSRITGYYRPVQNWNAGKAEEYRERKLYDVPNSKLRRAASAAEAYAEPAARAAKLEGEAILFTTATCPNCKIAKKLLADAGIRYRVVDASDEMDLAREFDVRSVPTLVVAGEGEAVSYVSALQIRQFVEARKREALAAAR